MMAAFMTGREIPMSCGSGDGVLKWRKRGGRMAWYVYMLRCGDGSLYTGSTTDVARRLREHQNGTGAKYTRTRPPVSQAYTEEAPDRSTAQRREAAIKKLPRKRKLALIEGGTP